MMKCVCCKKTLSGKLWQSSENNNGPLENENRPRGGKIKVLLENIVW